MDSNKEFTLLYNKFKPNLLRFAYSISKNSDIAHEIVAETFYCAYQNFNQLKNKRAFLSYLFTIATRVNSKLNKLSKQYVDVEIDFDEYQSMNYSPEQITDFKILKNAILQLKESERDTLVLTEFVGLKNSEVSQIMGISIFNVKIRLYRAKKNLALLLKEKV